MNRLIFGLSLLLGTLSVAQDNLRPSLESTYSAWRESIIRRDVSAWQRVTAEHQQVEVRNRIISEKKPYPSSIFSLPAPPPSLQGLKFLEAKQKGPTAKASYFGKIDFAVGGQPSDNLLVLSFIKGSGGWLYDRADFVNLEALSTVRKELASGDTKYLDETPEAQPSGIIPQTPIAANSAKYVAKVYVFCPGREVKVQINKISRHRFANAKEAEIVIGGAVDGLNEVQYTIENLKGGKGNEVMTLRVYLMSESQGVKPIKIFEYQLAEGEKPQAVGTKTFEVTAATAAALQSK